MSLGQSCGPESAFAGAAMEDSQINMSAVHHHYVMHLSPDPLAGKPASVLSADNFFWSFNWMVCFTDAQNKLIWSSFLYPLLPFPPPRVLYSFLGWSTNNWALWMCIQFPEEPGLELGWAAMSSRNRMPGKCTHGKGLVIESYNNWLL